MLDAHGALPLARKQSFSRSQLHFVRSTRDGTRMPSRLWLSGKHSRVVFITNAVSLNSKRCSALMVRMYGIRKMSLFQSEMG